MAEVGPVCPICGKEITQLTYSQVRWPVRGPVKEADFRPHEMVFKQPSLPDDAP
jgi:hypothetical protein